MCCVSGWWWGRCGSTARGQASWGPAGPITETSTHSTSSRRPRREAGTIIHDNGAGDVVADETKIAKKATRKAGKRNAENEHEDEPPAKQNKNVD